MQLFVTERSFCAFVMDMGQVCMCRWCRLTQKLWQETLQFIKVTVPPGLVAYFSSQICQQDC